MTPESATESSELDLQFDASESSPAAPTCGACSATIATEYYEAGGAVVCAECRAAIEARRGTGSGAGRVTRAALFGLGGAVVGAALYYGIVALTGYEIGLVAIAVGWLVGRGVQLGSRERGGRLYQGLAVALTYIAIVSTYIPFIVSAFNEETVAAVAPSDSTSAAAVVPGASAAASPAADPAADAVEPAADAAAEPAGAVTVLLGLGLLLLLAMAAPFLAGLENIIGIAIIGFALYQAWRMNARSEIIFTGPYSVGASPRQADA